MITFQSTGRPPIIEMRNIVQSYGSKTILNGCDLLIEDKDGKGEFVVLMGISGSGKSTLLRYIAGLQEATSGSIFINGKQRTDETVGMVFQDYSSFPWRTVIENVEFPLELRGISKKERRKQAEEMLARVGLAGHESKYAQAPTLSGGQLQRLAIARSLISNPKVLLMDEPFGALDTVTRHDMQMMLAKLWDTLQTTIIFVTHDCQEAVFLADDVYVLDPRIGKVGHHVHIDLPSSRDKTTKQEPSFFRLVSKVEDAIVDTAQKLVVETPTSLVAL